MTDWNAELRAELGTWTCTICGKENTAGLGYWAVPTGPEDDNTHVCTGRCWRQYEKMKAERKALTFWVTLCPELAT